MQKQCPYCGAAVPVTRLFRHVRELSDDDHGDHGTLPDPELVDSPWSSRVSFADDARALERDDAEIAVIKRNVARGRCPACDRGAMALKGGDGLFASGRRRFACPNCGWESPEWVEVD